MYSQPTILLVTYGLKGPSTQYGAFYDALKKEQSWWHYLPSTWLIATRKSPKELFHELQPHLGEGDHLLVVRFSEDHWGWLPRKAWDWIKTH